MQSETAQTPTAPIKVFLSYARADRLRVERLAGALKRAGVEVWWDSELRGGSVFPEEIEHALAQAQAVIVVWSHASVRSHWVQDEAGRGRDRSRLIPVMIDAVTPPLGFGQYQALNFTGWKGEDEAPVFGELIDALNNVTGRETNPRLSPKQPVLNRRRVLYGAGAGAAALGVVAAGAVALKGLGPGSGGGVKHIAVLPFDNLTGDPAQDYIPKGLAEELRSQLGDIPGLRLLGMVTTTDVVGHGGDPRSLLKTLGADYLLSGSFRALGGAARIDAETIDATGLSVMRKQYDRQESDLLSLEADIAQEYAQALIQQLEPQGSGAKGEGDGTHNKVARDAYIHGLAEETSEVEPELRSAVGHFRQAVELDPRYARAQAALARASLTLAMNYAPADEGAALLDTAISAADAALRLAPDMADALSTIGYVQFFGRLDATAAKAPFDRAYRNGQGQGRVLSRFAAYAYRVGRFAEAQAALRDAIRLDARNPQIHRNLGLMRIAQRRFEKAIEPLEQGLSINPQLPSARAYIGLSWLGAGRADKARAAFAADGGSEISWVGMAILEHQAGRLPEAASALGKLISEGDRSLYQQAQVKAQWGQTDAALSILEAAYKIKDAGLTNIGVDFTLDPLRREPRFLKLLSSIGLT